MTDIGERIAYLRKISNMSQEELGRRVGVQRAAINKYEKGGVANIPLRTIEKIAEVFDVSPTYLVGWSNTVSNPLSAEVKVLNGVKSFYGSDAVKLLETYTLLNNIGRKRLFQYADELELLYSTEQIDYEVQVIKE